MGRNSIDREGEQRGYLNVMSKDIHSKYTRWICFCNNCGSTTSLDRQQLSEGHCGCMSKEREPAIEKEKLYELYAINRLNNNEIAKITGLHRNTISKYIKEYGIERLPPSRKELFEGYVVNSYTRTKMSKNLGVTKADISSYIKLYELDEDKYLYRYDVPVNKKPRAEGPTPNRRRGPKSRKLLGRKFGRLEVIEYIGDKTVKCRCDCGNDSTVATNNLYSGNTTSCGCLKCEKLGPFVIHGLSNDRLYIAWRGMIQRCENPNNKSYQYYGGRGITVCEEWHDANTFIQWASKSGYKKNLTIDRINNNEGYNPENCKWSTHKQQMNNRKNNILITIDNDTKTLARWVDEFNLDYSEVYRRYRNGYRNRELFT